MAVGDDNTTPTVSDTTLGNETYREAIFKSSSGGSFVAWDLKLDTTENNGSTIKEVGTFTASSGGTMYTRNLSSSFDKDSTNEAYYQSRITINTQITDLD